MKTITTSIDIAQTPERIWETLVDLDAYTEWNPFIISAAGTPAEGERLQIQLLLPNGREVGFKPRVTAVVPAERLAWLGRIGLRGLFDGRHEFRIEPLTDSHSRFHQSETFSGVLVGILLNEADVQSGFRAMNSALKDRVERPAVDIDIESVGG